MVKLNVLCFPGLPVLEKKAEVYWLIAELKESLPKAVSAGGIRTNFEGAPMPGEYHQEWIAYWYGNSDITLHEIVRRALAKAVSFRKTSIDMELPRLAQHIYHRCAKMKGEKAISEMVSVLEKAEGDIVLNLILPWEGGFNGFFGQVKTEYDKLVPA